MEEGRIQLPKQVLRQVHEKEEDIFLYIVSVEFIPSGNELFSSSADYTAVSSEENFLHTFK